MNRVFVDESGNTGDLVNVGAGIAFNGQPHFVLCGVGPTGDETMAQIISDVARVHHLQMAEIKSEKLKKRPWVARDIALALREAGIAIFVEAVDKRFYLMTQIVNSQVMSPVTLGQEGDVCLRNEFGDFLHENLPNNILQSFIDACLSDSLEATRDSLTLLLAWARNYKAPSAQKNEVAGAMAHSLTESEDDFRIAVKDDAANYRRFLPIPDKGKKRSIYWIMPHYSSLTNLYARINHHLNGAVGGISIVHDSQTQYDDVLREAKQAVENLKESDTSVHGAARYNFTQSACLEFALSQNTAGLMVADVLAGHVRRLLRDHQERCVIHPDSWRAFESIWNAPITQMQSSINFVLATATVRSLQFATLSASKVAAENLTHRSGA